MVSFFSSLTRGDWSPTSFLDRVLKSHSLFQSSSHLSSCTSSSSSPNPTSNSFHTTAISVPMETSPSSAVLAAPPAPPPVSQQEMVALGHIFDHFDENKDGKISRDELRRSLRMLGIETDDEELVAMIEAADWNSDGHLDFSEFASFYYSLNEEMGQKMEASHGMMMRSSKHNREGEEADLRDAFKLFDKDGDGFICAEELQSVLGSMGLSQGKLLADCRNMIHSVDVDGDGQVSFDEFKQMMVAGFGQG